MLLQTGFGSISVVSASDVLLESTGGHAVLKSTGSNNDVLVQSASGDVSIQASGDIRSGISGTGAHYITSGSGGVRITTTGDASVEGDDVSVEASSGHIDLVVGASKMVSLHKVGTSYYGVTKYATGSATPDSTVEVRDGEMAMVSLNVAWDGSTFTVSDSTIILLTLVQGPAAATSSRYDSSGGGIAFG